MIKYSTNANNKFVIKRNIAPIAPKQLKCALHYTTHHLKNLRPRKSTNSIEIIFT